MIRDLFKQHADFGRKRDLLTSIPGIGEITAARLLAEIPNMLDFKSAKEIAAFAGLSPQHFLSGTSDHGLGRHDGESDPEAPKFSAHPVDTG